MIGVENSDYSQAVQALFACSAGKAKRWQLKAWSQQLRDTEQRALCCLTVLQELGKSRAFPDAPLLTQLLDALAKDGRRSLCFTLFESAKRKKVIDGRLLDKMMLICQDAHSTPVAQKVYDMTLSNPEWASLKISHVFMQIMGQAGELGIVMWTYERLRKARCATARSLELCMQQCNRSCQPQRALKLYQKAPAWLKTRSYPHYVQALGATQRVERLMHEWRQSLPKHASDAQTCTAFLYALADANRLPALRKTYKMACAAIESLPHELSLAYMRAEAKIGDRDLAEHVYDQLIEAGANFYDVTEVFINSIGWKEQEGHWEAFRETEEFIWVPKQAAI